MTVTTKCTYLRILMLGTIRDNESLSKSGEKIFPVWKKRRQEQWQLAVHIFLLLNRNFVRRAPREVSFYVVPLSSRSVPETPPHLVCMIPPKRNCWELPEKKKYSMLSDQKRKYKMHLVFFYILLWTSSWLYSTCVYFVHFFNSTSQSKKYIKIYKSTT